MGIIGSAKKVVWLCILYVIWRVIGEKLWFEWVGVGYHTPAGLVILVIGYAIFVIIPFFILSSITSSWFDDIL